MKRDAFLISALFLGITILFLYKNNNIKPQIVSFSAKELILQITPFGESFKKDNHWYYVIDCDKNSTYAHHPFCPCQE